MENHTHQTKDSARGTHAVLGGLTTLTAQMRSGSYQCLSPAAHVCELSSQSLSQTT